MGFRGVGSDTVSHAKTDKPIKMANSRGHKETHVLANMMDQSVQRQRCGLSVPFLYQLVLHCMSYWICIMFISRRLWFLLIKFLLQETVFIAWLNKAALTALWFPKAASNSSLLFEVDSCIDRSHRTLRVGVDKCAMPNRSVNWLG